MTRTQSDFNDDQLRDDDAGDGAIEAALAPHENGYNNLPNQYRRTLIENAFPND